MDEYKDRLNRAKHGVSFETAQLAFDDSVAARPLGHPLCLNRLN
jgi:uncharacterized DUF497 family protein